MKLSFRAFKLIQQFTADLNLKRQPFWDILYCDVTKLEISSFYWVSPQKYSFSYFPILKTVQSLGLAVRLIMWPLLWRRLLRGLARNVLQLKWEQFVLTGCIEISGLVFKICLDVFHTAAILLIQYGFGDKSMNSVPHAVAFLEKFSLLSKYFYILLDLTFYASPFVHISLNCVT